MKGIILAGGTGTRLWPATHVVSKQLLPVYDKPMIYYPLATLMLAGIREILLITTPQDQKLFQNLFHDGSTFGVSLTYAVQDKPAGLAQALIIGESFLNSHPCLMILGDNIFHGVGLGRQLTKPIQRKGAHIFVYEVSNPSDYGVLSVDDHDHPVSIVEKPALPESNLAVTGLYYFDEECAEIAKRVQPSARGELEITSVLNSYLSKGILRYSKLSRGTTWLDTGTPESLQDASNYIKIIEERTGMKIGCLEEIAYDQGWISNSDLLRRIDYYKGNSYAQYLKRII